MRSKRSARKAREKRQRNRRLAGRNAKGYRTLRCEPLESRVLLDAGGLLPGDPLLVPIPDPADHPPPLESGVISGLVWEDADGNRQRDNSGQGDAEAGMGGVIVYSDLNFNGIRETNEPSTMTSFDDPTTDFDEGGLYTLNYLQPGWHNIRQVVPDGFEQTYPSLPDGYLPPPWGDSSVHITFVEQGQVVDEVDFGNKKIELGSISGVKWDDANGNAEFDPWESGLAGVTIYADLNDNDVLDANEPSAITTADIPETDFDEGGRYTLAGLAAGDYVIREVVPDGFQQTYPLIDLPRPLPAESNAGADGDIVADEFATVEPGRLDFILAAGEVFVADVAVTIHPSIFAPIEIDVIVSSVDVEIINLSGPQLNGGTGETSVFQILIISSGTEFDGELQFIDLLGGNAFASIPLTIGLGTPSDGSHRVTLRPGGVIEGIDFGNQAIVADTGTVSGRKWEDSNGNGLRDANEVGLGGVTIYSDLNLNFTFDADEPHAVTMFDIPETDFDEGGLYSISNLVPGFHVIREVVPSDYWQTFPISISASPLEHGAHYVNLEPNGYIDNLDFGNQQIALPLPGDFNDDGVVDGIDLGVWEESFGSGNSQANADATSGGMDGASFLMWQRNLGAVSVVQPLSASSSQDAALSTLKTESSAPVASLAAVELTGSPLGSSREQSLRARRGKYDVLEAVFAESSQSNWRASDLAPLTSNPPSESTRARSSRPIRGAYDTFSNAIDAALESDFGE